jgi:plasmid stabilization system protein ParE
MTYSVRFTKRAEADLLRLYDFLIEAADLNVAQRALDAITNAITLLGFSPFSCRKVSPGGDTAKKVASQLPRHRELVIPFGAAGYVALFEIEDAKTVTILAVRHQREDDLW